MNIAQIKEYLSDDKERVIDLLNSVGFENIKYLRSGNEIRCSRDEDRNPSSVRIDLDTLCYYCFSTNDKGDIISLIQSKMNYKFPEALKYIKKHFNLENVEIEERKLPFNGFYKKLLQHNANDDSNLITYPESMLNEYRQIPNLRFLQDKIDIHIQDEYKLGYDLCSSRITLPWRNSNGELIGVVGRLNEEVTDDMPKYLALIPFPKSQALYGFSEDYDKLAGKTIFIAEAEKSKLIAKSFGINNVVAIGSHNLSTTQVRIIKSLHPQKIIMAYDEGIDTEYVREECRKFNKNNYFKYKVGYINNTILPKDSKMSPFDLGNNVQKIIKEGLVWVDH